MAWQNALLRVYAWLLKLYPAQFYTQFADEMRETFQLRLQESPQFAARIGLQEIGALIVAIVRERQRTPDDLRLIPGWQKALLALPVICGCALLLFRPISNFFLPGKAWFIFAGISLVIVVIGWLYNRRSVVLALPILGFMLSIALRIFFEMSMESPGFGTKVEIRFGVPCILLTIVLVYTYLRGQGRSRWLLYLAAFPVCGLVTALLALWASNTFYGGLEQNLSLIEVYRSYIRGMIIPFGTLSLLILIGLPLAYPFGSKAVLLIVGYLFSDLVGLSATLWNNELQRVTGAIFLVLFLLLIPLLTLRSSRHADERRSVLLPTALAYGLVFLVKALTEGTEPIFTLYRIGELIQTLIALTLAIEVYARFMQKAKPDEASQTRAVTA